MKASDIKKGNVVEYNNGIYQIRDIERSSPQGRGGNVRFRFIMYSVPGGQKLDASFDADDQLSEVELLRRQAAFSYKDGEAWVFMDEEDYSLYSLDTDVLGDAHVALEVIETPPELKGGTATKRPKPARLNTGIEIMVPEYIRTGERVWVNTVTGEFGGRAD